jgi:hypothetical protein
MVACLDKDGNSDDKRSNRKKTDDDGSYEGSTQVADAKPFYVFLPRRSPFVDCIVISLAAVKLVRLSATHCSSRSTKERTFAIPTERDRSRLKYKKLRSRYPQNRSWLCSAAREKEGLGCAWGPAHIYICTVWVFALRNKQPVLRKGKKVSPIFGSTTRRSWPLGHCFR